MAAYSSNADMAARNGDDETIVWRVKLPSQGQNQASRSTKVGHVESG